jgi:hypothetical protein
MHKHLSNKLVRISLAALLFTTLASTAPAQFSPIPFISSATANLTNTARLLRPNGTILPGRLGPLLSIPAGGPRAASGY